MNRKERRKKGLKDNKPATYNLTLEQIAAIEIKARTEEADKILDTSMILMLSIPILVIQRHFKELIRVTVDGKSRTERFTELLMQYYYDFENGKHDLQEYRDMLDKEAGVVLVRKGKNGRIEKA